MYIHGSKFLLTKNWFSRFKSEITSFRIWAQSKGFHCILLGYISTIHVVYKTWFVVVGTKKLHHEAGIAVVDQNKTNNELNARHIFLVQEKWIFPIKVRMKGQGNTSRIGLSIIHSYILSAYCGLFSIRVCCTVKKGYRFSRPQPRCHLPSSPLPRII